MNCPKPIFDMTFKHFLRLAVLGTFFSLPATAQTSADSTAIVANALDYIEGWYEGNAERMERALHPDLAKRIVNSPLENSQLGDMTAETLIDYTRRGGGRTTPADEQQKDVTILDIYNDAAVVKIVASSWIDYLQVSRWNGEWKIINVLWAMKSRG